MAAGLNVTFSIHPTGFVVHVPHQKSGTYYQTRKSGEWYRVSSADTGLGMDCSAFCPCQPWRTCGMVDHRCLQTSYADPQRSMTLDPLCWALLREPQRVTHLMLLSPCCALQLRRLYELVEKDIQRRRFVPVVSFPQLCKL
jgi:hypothetical protein